MDIRNLKMEGDLYDMFQQSKSLKPIQSMRKHQKNLMDFYSKIENWPPMPLDINQRASQVLIKDFLSRGIEECSELHNSIIESDNTRKSTDNNQLTDAHQLSLSKSLMNAMEELVDIYHFHLEVMIAIGYSPIMKMDKTIMSADHIHIYDVEQQSKNYIFNYIHACNNVRMKLKNKAWKQSDILTPKFALEKSLNDLERTFWELASFVCNTIYINYWVLKTKPNNVIINDHDLRTIHDHMATTEASDLLLIVEHYYIKKNYINQQRIKSGY